MIWKAYLDHAHAQNLAKTPFMRICREVENCRDLRTLSSFCDKDLAIRKVFAFCDSDVLVIVTADF